jgi:protein-disulfide isomerase
MATQSGGDKVTKYIVIGMVSLVLVVGVLFSVLSHKTSQNASLPNGASKAQGYGIVFNGELKGVPVVDIWEDFQCPVCQAFEKLNGDYIEKLITTKKATFIYHPLSFIGPDSVLLANAAACAADENQFLPYHRFLYQNQQPENSGKWSSTVLDSSGVAVGIASAKFSACVNTNKYTAWVGNVENDGAQKTINSTPTVFVNGKEINRKTQYFDAAAFASVIEKG